MSEAESELAAGPEGSLQVKTGITEKLSFGGVQFASGIYMAFSSYYLLMFFTDLALISPAAVAALLFCHRLFSVAAGQGAGLFINRMHFKEGKYRPYFKWCALPFAAGLAALGLPSVLGMQGISGEGRIICAAFALLLCELCQSTLYTASMAMLPYLAPDDVNRTKFISFSNSSAILAFILVGTFMLPLANFLGGGSRDKGFTLTLALFALIAGLLVFNAYFRLKEGNYGDIPGKAGIKEILLAIGRNRRIMLFLAGYCLYSMADAFKNLTAYYYVTYNMERPDLLPVIILAGLVSPLAVQPVIPRLLAFAKKEVLIIAGLFSASSAGLLMLAAGKNPFALVPCVVLYGASTAIAANLVFTVMASFSDEMRLSRNISMSEILTAALSLSSNLGVAVTGGVVPLAMAAFGYSAQTASQTAGTLAGIRALYILCTAGGLALAGFVMLLFRRCKTTHAF